MIYPSNKIYAKKTKDMGWGVFASEKIIKGDSIDVNYCIEIKDNNPKLFYDYAFMCPRKKKDVNDISFRVIPLGLGSVINHSSDPNADWKDGEHKWTLEWYAIKDIEKDEQIFTDYGKSYWKNVCRIKNIKQ